MFSYCFIHLSWSVRADISLWKNSKKIQKCYLLSVSYNICLLLSQPKFLKYKNKTDSVGFYHYNNNFSPNCFHIVVFASNDGLSSLFCQPSVNSALKSIRTTASEVHRAYWTLRAVIRNNACHNILYQNVFQY